MYQLEPIHLWSLRGHQCDVLYAQVRFFLVDPAVCSTKGRSFAAFGRCNYTKSLISMNRHWLAEQFSNDAQHRHTRICPWLELMILCVHIWSHLFNSYSFFPESITLQLLTLVMYEYKVQKIGIKQRWKIDLLWFIVCVHFWFEISLKWGGSQKQGFMDVIAFNAAISACVSGRLVATGAVWDLYRIGKMARFFQLQNRKNLTDPEFLWCERSESHVDMQQKIGLMKVIRNPDCHHGCRQNDSNKMITNTRSHVGSTYHSKIMFSLLWAARKRQKHVKPLCTLN